MAEHPNHPLVHYARACWSAEEENSRRLALRINLVLSIVAALFGLGLFKPELYADPSKPVAPTCGPEATLAIRVLLLLSFLSVMLAALSLFSTSLYTIVLRPKRFLAKLLRRLSRDQPDPPLHALAPHPTPLATVALVIPKTRLGPLLSGIASPAEQRVFAQTYRAFLLLHQKNLRQKQVLDVAQQWVVIAVVLVVCSIMVYSFSETRTSLPPSVRTNP